MRLLHVGTFSFASLFVVVAVAACAGDQSGPPGPKSEPGIDLPRGGGDGAATDASADAASDESSAPVAVRCTQAEFDAAVSAEGGDFTGLGDVEIVFPTTEGPAQYSNHCAKVKVGASVTFTGSFTNHPLEPNGGDSPSPIQAVNDTPDGGAITFTVDAPGTFGYECGVHPGIMFGAIQVVP